MQRVYHNGTTEYYIAKLVDGKALSQRGYDTIKGAAIALDKYLINSGRDPINVLKSLGSKD
tara:strand:+ start:888 stop:1070 length:183 start_codon:yes stop_codon:yes gene_type:complete